MKVFPLHELSFWDKDNHREKCMAVGQEEELIKAILLKQPDYIWMVRMSSRSVR